MNLRRGILLAVVLALVGAFFLFDIGSYLTLDTLNARQTDLLAWRANHPWQSGLAFFAVYVMVTALSLPGAAIMTLAIGALFGLVTATILVSFASTAGATLAFLLARTLFRDPVKRRFGDRLAPIEAGLSKDGALYLLSLRLAPVFPFFLINILMGLTEMPVLRYALVSQVGMLPGTIVYVNAGTQLASLTSLKGILSPPVLGSLLLLALFPRGR